MTFSGYAEQSFTGKISAIPADIKKQMIGTVWHKDCPVALDELDYLQLPYWGFDDKPHMGEMIVHQIVAKEVVDIFEKLYRAHFPIEKMVLPGTFLHNNSLSGLPLGDLNSVANNTSGFFCRPDGQSPHQYSPHSFGLAIDINPLYNPGIIDGGKAEPALGVKYLNRDLKVKGMIKEDDLVTTTFYAYGWKWGAYFSQGVDYMHFQKMINAKYVAERIKPRVKNENPTIPPYY